MPSERLQRIQQLEASVLPAHIAIIMDGNGRWATERGLPRREGHRAGMRSVREVVEGAIEAGVGILTLFAFSAENWLRPAREISFLMSLLQHYARSELEDLTRNGVKVDVVGELERLPGPGRRAVDSIVTATREGERLQLVLAISYGSRGEIVRAVRRLAEKVAAGELKAEEIDEEAFGRHLDTAAWPDPDLLIRTSGEYRISNFMLWQLAYTELYSTPVLWPDFSREDLFEAILEYGRRERRFGKVAT